MSGEVSRDHNRDLIDWSSIQVFYDRKKMEIGGSEAAYH